MMPHNQRSTEYIIERGEKRALMLCIELPIGQKIGTRYVCIHFYTAYVLVSRKSYMPYRTGPSGPIGVTQG